MDISDQVALICGGTGRVGSAIASALASYGANVAIHYRQNAQEASRIVDQINSSGGKAVAFQADLTNESSVIRLFDEVRSKLGSIQILVNSVHGQFDPKNIAEMAWKDWDVHLEALKIHFNLCKNILPIMRIQRYGRIIFISGGLSKRYFKGCSGYTTVKAGLNGFCKTLALEEGMNGITVNIVAPGKVVTLDERPSTDNPAAWDEMNRHSLSKSPLGRDANATDVAHAVLYFASREAACITGQTLFVTGGEIMP